MACLALHFFQVSKTRLFVTAFMKRQTYYLKHEGNRKGLAFFTALQIAMVLVNKKCCITETISWVARNKHSKYVKKGRFSKDCFKYSLFLRAAREWHKLSERVVNETYCEQFWTHLQQSSS